MPWARYVRPPAVRHGLHFLWSTDRAHKGGLSIESQHQDAEDDLIVHHLEVFGKHLQSHLLQRPIFVRRLFMRTDPCEVHV
jgi:hypothetical protein